ncbi:MAG: RluA family pseudouridine synthase [Microcystaceae cyanobacterium]
MNQGWTYTDKIQTNDEGITVLDYYIRNYPHSTQEEWLDRILTGQICLNHQIISPDTKLKAGQTLTYDRSPWQEPDVPLSFKILHEDDHLLVINKPSGLPVLPGGNFLEHTLLHQLKHKFPHEKVVPIHRLGRGTSGLILIGRSKLGRSYLTQQMRNRQIKKVYRTLIGKSHLPDSFTIDQPIGKIPYPSIGYLYAATPEGKFAYSEGKVLERTEQNTHLEVRILTGRPHQIRIHLAAIGYPLLGDPLYKVGGIPKLNELEKLALPGDCGYFLHAYQLTFHHPQTHQLMNFICPAN